MARWRTFQEKYGVASQAGPPVAASGASVSAANLSNRSAISAYFRSASVSCPLWLLHL